VVFKSYNEGLSLRNINEIVICDSNSSSRHDSETCLNVCSRICDLKPVHFDFNVPVCKGSTKRDYDIQASDGCGASLFRVTVCDRAVVVGCLHEI
jgi:hypothetical protein